MKFFTDQTKKIGDLIKGYTKTGSLDFYREAQERCLTVSDLLEELDPTPQGEHLDAFERQLQLHGILDSGLNSITVESFFAGSGAALMPEYITRQILHGYRLTQNPEELVGSIVSEQGPQVTPIYINFAKAKKTLALRAYGSGTAYPKVELLYRIKPLQIVDRGFEFDFDYKVIRNQRLTEFKVFLWWIGATMANDELSAIYDCLLNGDGTSPALVSVFTGVGGTWAYTDVIHLAMAIDLPGRMTHLLGLGTDIEKTIALTQFQDALAFKGRELFQRTGDYKDMIPMNAKLVIVPGATSTKLIGMDARFAIRETVSQPMMVEADKVINQKLEQCVLSKESVYSVMVEGTAKLSDY